MISLGTPLSVSLNDFPPHFFNGKFQQKKEKQHLSGEILSMGLCGPWLVECVGGRGLALHDSALAKY